MLEGVDYASRQSERCLKLAFERAPWSFWLGGFLFGHNRVVSHWPGCTAEQPAGNWIIAVRKGLQYLTAGNIILGPKSPYE